MDLNVGLEVYHLQDLSLSQRRQKMFGGGSDQETSRWELLRWQLRPRAEIVSR
jgi:hypothetical protein